MVSYQRTGMKIPVRPAPAPPATSSKTIRQNSYNFDNWDDSFVTSGMNKSLTSHDGVVPKKKPPPRPPPPKFSQPPKKGKVPSRPSELLSGFFSRKSQKLRESQNKYRPPKPPQPTVSIGVNQNVSIASLIDLHSPPSSPTPTTRSSSDGVSVNSFGSDGNSSGGPTPRTAPASLFESGFEDDFDFFGGLSSSNIKPITQNDPWSMNKIQDPFSPLPQHSTSTTSSTKPAVLTKSSSTTWFNDQPSNVMPTIIRTKGPAPKPKFQNRNNFAKSISKETSRPENDDWSPPMPSIPPPPPPPEAFEDLDDIYPEDTNINQNHLPHGIAIYDFESTHSDDLAFQKNDTVYIENEVNSEWLYGQVGNRRGMFPANFIRIIVPLNSNKTTGQIREENLVTAIYKFAAESWDDLEFPEGAKINVIRQINAEWLYGEYDGRTGQFPASFVDRIPSL